MLVVKTVDELQEKIPELDEYRDFKNPKEFEEFINKVNRSKYIVENKLNFKQYIEVEQEDGSKVPSIIFLNLGFEAKLRLLESNQNKKSNNCSLITSTINKKQFEK